ncbi:tetratricopeptide repeat protein [Thalassotalea sp. M1531]|uniref:Tetratricopeptide repeat protein n=1 Tax=Thalassotalea algicola TaxID=2716224 RepID=A0A7Y0LF52_9GAMM|nr:tetratricopeptide repeat-containing sulfotransferase family protein [Thalassotalea algicola]NMP33369.1 tetratricopeptide repeat protein [Thalassotalea algicola]
MNINQILNQAEQAHQSGQLEQASTLYQSIVNQQTSIDALYGLATVKMQQQDFASALPLFERALAIEPSALDISFNYILCLKHVNLIDKATELLARVIQSIPSNSDFIAPYAQLAFSLNAYKHTIAIIERNTQETPQLAILLVQSHMALGDWTNAITRLNQLKKQFPNNYEVLNNLAICYGKTLNFSLAIPLFEQLIMLKPDNDNYIRMADLYLLAQQKENAEFALNKVSSDMANNIQVLILRCKLARLNHNKEQALAFASRILEISSNASIAWQVVGEFGDDKQQSLLVEQLSSLIDTSNETSFESRQNLYTLGKAYEKRQQFKNAFQAFIKANESQRKELIDAQKQYSPSVVQQEYEQLKAFKYVEKSQLETTNNVFIVGMPRSGTTLVNRLLSQNPGAISVNESNGISATFEQLLQHMPQAEVGNYLKANANELVENYQKFIGIDNNIVIDKMPHNFRFVGAILATFPAAKIIQMRRAPQDLALSIYCQQFNDYHSYACDLPSIAHAVAEANKLMDYWKKVFPKQVYDLDYQNLVEAPTEQAKLLFDFLNLPWQQEYLNFYKQAVPSFTFSEVQVRKPINRSKIGFSTNYSLQLKPFTEAYNKLST